MGANLAWLFIGKVHLSGLHPWRSLFARHIVHFLGLHPQEPPWSERYPELVRILEFHPDLPTGTTFEGNVAVNCAKLLNLGGKKEELQFSKIGKNLEYKEGGFFVAPEKLDFRLRDDAPFLKELPAFQRCDFAKIGLYKDEDRPSLPIEAELKRNVDPGQDSRNDADPLNTK